MNHMPNNNDCDSVTSGLLPECGKLAVSYVPVQENADHRYESEKALTRGTLFTGLDLPYRNFIGEEIKSPNAEERLMALGFAVHELGLYLDTHPDDKEAGRMFNQYNKQYAEAVEAFERCYGPLTMTSADGEDYTWATDPFPWHGKPRMPKGKDCLMNGKED